MKIIEMPCIVCPMSCRIEAECGEAGEVTAVRGNQCPRGEKYIRSELTAPMRMLTSTVIISGGMYSRLPVILSGEIPRECLLRVMKELEHVRVFAPVEINDIILKDVCGLSVDVLASRSMCLAESV